jgi:hypothetical protein
VNAIVSANEALFMRFSANILFSEHLFGLQANMLVREARKSACERSMECQELMPLGGERIELGSERTLVK